jgi:hypothetical protein
VKGHLLSGVGRTVKCFHGFRPGDEFHRSQYPTPTVSKKTEN